MDFESLLLQTRERETLPGALLSAHPRHFGGAAKARVRGFEGATGLALLVAQGELLGLSEPFCGCLNEEVEGGTKSDNTHVNVRFIPTGG